MLTLFFSRNLLIYFSALINEYDKVIEDIRPHRIVYSKTLAFCNFLDVQPTTEELIIAIRKNRKEIPVIHKISNKQDLEKLKEEIICAYENIN